MKFLATSHPDGFLGAAGVGGLGLSWGLVVIDINI